MKISVIQKEIKQALAMRTQTFSTGNHVDIVGVSKTRTPDEIILALSSGIKILGENQVQEAAKKILQIPGANWHLIGHLQTNKAKQAVQLFDLIHSIDSHRLLLEVDKQAARMDKIQNILLQINVAQEKSKFGLSLNELENLVQIALQLKNIKLQGFMVIAPLTNNQEVIKNVFRRGYQQYERFRGLSSDISILSMGMSDDYLVAIQEGANMVRLGSKIFGPRVYK